VRKFVLIDQSIKNSGGHHLEYALRVLKAAKEQGLETILAVNKKCDPIQSEYVDRVEHLFSHTFWENVIKYKGERLTRHSSFLNLLKEKKDRVLYDLLYSQSGMIYNALRNQPTKTMVGKYAGRNEVGSIGVIKIMLIKTLLIILQSFKAVAVRANNLINKFGNFGRLLKRTCLLLLVLLFSPLLLLYLIPQFFILTKVSQKYSTQFKREMQVLLENCQIDTEDIIFVPTLAETELLGLLELSHISSLPLPAFHLLFRRNLFQGREPAFASQFEDVQESRIVLNRFEREKGQGVYHFYTDTEHLTNQYNSLGAMTFQTLPIPHDETLNKEKTVVDDTPLLISSIGDARTEKGFQHLPKLISDLEAKGIDKQRVKYQFQSNFNVPEGEPAPRVAKAMLSNYPEDYVQLLEGPFDSEKYTSLVNSSDILLIPYDKNNYYARSSGILAEALVAGVPVVVPSGTWMSSAFAYEQQKYLEQEFNQAGNLKSSLNFPYVNVCIPNGVASVIIELEWNRLEKGIHCCLQLQRLIPSNDNRHQEMWNNENSDTVISEPLTNKTYSLLRINQQGCYRLSLSIDNSLESISDSQALLSHIKNVTIKGVETDIPASVIATTYTDVDRLSDAVSELVNHYPHYLNTALTFKKSWSIEHSSKNLVHQLANKFSDGDAL
jgi:hypothetical protein